jgi:hypothetical protein
VNSLSALCPGFYVQCLGVLGVECLHAEPDDEIEVGGAAASYLDHLAGCLLRALVDAGEAQLHATTG